MLKKYIPDELGHADKYWDQNWHSMSIESAVSFCEADPIRAVLDEYLPRRGKILEAGCGLGQWVVYYRRKGYLIEGVDYAEETIKRILEYDGKLPVKIADVRWLPYPDDYFDAYYSGGVIEHFEEGPYVVLQEAARVLKNGGILIISVPYMNLMRQLSSLFKNLGHKSRYNKIIRNKHKYFNYAVVSQHEVEHNDFDGSGIHFHEYYYRKAEIVQVLKNAHFNILDKKLCSIGWGMRDFRVFRSIIKLIEGKTKPLAGSYAGNQFIERKEQLLTKLKRAFVSESSESLFLQGILFVLRHLFSNMIVLICNARKQDRI